MLSKRRYIAASEVVSEVVSDEWHGAAATAGNVIETEQSPAFTGLYDAAGNKLYAVTMRQLGFHLARKAGGDG